MAGTGKIKHKSSKSLNIVQVENHLQDIAYLNIIALHLIKNCYSFQSKNFDVANLESLDKAEDLHECISATAIKINEMRHLAETMTFNSSERVIVSQFISDCSKLMDLICFKKQESSLEQLRRMKLFIKRNMNTIFDFAMYISPISSGIYDTVLLILRLCTYNDNISFIGSNFKGYKFAKLTSIIDDNLMVNKTTIPFNRIIVLQYVFEYLVQLKLKDSYSYKNSKNQLYYTLFKPTTKNLSEYVRLTGVYLRPDISKIGPEEMGVFDYSMSMSDAFIGEIKSIYFNNFIPSHNIIDEEYVYLKIPSSKFLKRNRIIPQNGLIQNLITDGKVTSSIEVKEIHEGNRHALIFKTENGLENGNIMGDILSFNMENPELRTYIGNISNIALMLYELGVLNEEENISKYMFSSENISIYDKISKEDQIEVSKMFSIKNMLEKVKDSHGELQIVLETPSSWNFKNRNHRLNILMESKSGNKSEVNKTPHFIDIHTRKIQGHASEEAMRFAKNHYLEIGKGLTVVKPHIRNI